MLLVLVVLVVLVSERRAIRRRMLPGLEVEEQEEARDLAGEKKPESVEEVEDNLDRTTLSEKASSDSFTGPSVDR